MRLANDFVCNRRRRQRWRRYYSGGFYGVPSAVLAYQLASELSKARNDLLWLAIVGLTDHFLHNRMHYDTYYDHVMALQQEVRPCNLSLFVLI